jgi:PPOX class probable F420-dependent enzyme
MSKREIKEFLMHGTYTVKLATVKNDGSPHVVPIWFVLDDGSKSKGKIDDIVLTTYDSSLKARNIRCDNRVCICIDDQIPQYSFVTIQGTARISHLKQNELLNWAIKIAGRYMGKNNAEAYGKRNSTEGAVLVRIKPKKIIAAKDTAEWE